MHGIGIYLWDDGSKYSGELVNGYKIGMGVYECANSYSYIGEYKNDKINRYGITKYINGDIL